MVPVHTGSTAAGDNGDDNDDGNDDVSDATSTTINQLRVRLTDLLCFARLLPHGCPSERNRHAARRVERTAASTDKRHHAMRAAAERAGSDARRLALHYRGAGKGACRLALAARASRDRSVALVGRNRALGDATGTTARHGQKAFLFARRVSPTAHTRSASQIVVAIEQIANVANRCAERNQGERRASTTGTARLRRQQECAKKKKEKK